MLTGRVQFVILKNPGIHETYLIASGKPLKGGGGNTKS